MNFPTIPRVTRIRMLQWLLIASSPAGAETVLSWDFPANSTAASSGSPPIPVVGISGSEVIADASGTTNAGVQSETSFWNRSGFDATSFEEALAAGDYYAFSVTAATGFDVSVTGVGPSALRIGSTGPGAMGLFYSADDVDYIQVGGTATLSTAGDVDVGAAFSMGMDPVQIGSGETGYWRIVAFGGTGTSNASRLRWRSASGTDFSLIGTVTPRNAPVNLRWAGANGGEWSTDPTKLHWVDAAMGGAQKAFSQGDNALITASHLLNIHGSGVVAGTVQVDNPAGATTTFAGGELAAFSLTKNGDGTLVIGGMNTFTAPTNIGGGILMITQSDALGTPAVNINGGTLSVIEDVLFIGNALNIGPGAATLEIAGETLLGAPVNTTGAAVNDSIALAKTGDGILSLEGSLGSQMTFGASGGAVEFGITEGEVKFSGSGSRNFGGTSVWDAAVTLGGGVYRLHGGMVTGTGPVNVSGDSTVLSRLNFGNAVINHSITIADDMALTLSAENGNNMLWVEGGITGGGKVQKGGNGIVRMLGESSYRGGTTLLSPTAGSGYSLQVGHDLALGSGPIVFRQGVTLAAFGGARTLANDIVAAGDFSLGGAGSPVVIAGSVDLTGGVRTISLGNSATLSGPVSEGGIVVASAVATRSLTLSGTNTYTGGTTVTSGVLRIDGDSSAATGEVAVLGGGALGGNGISGGVVSLSEDSALTATIRDWAGAAGTGYDVLDVAGLDAGGGSILVEIRSGDLVNFEESDASFTFLRAAGGITGFNGKDVTVAAPGFPGNGGWSVAQVGDHLVLSYKAGEASPYLAWATGEPYRLAGVDSHPAADPDNDGIPNAVEFVIGGNPVAAQDFDKLPTGSRSAEDFVVSFRRSMESAYLMPVVEYHLALSGAWNVARDGVGGVNISVTPDGFGAGIDRVEVRLTKALATGGRLFARLAVSVP